MTLSSELTNSPLWLKTLEAHDGDEYPRERERLRNAFLGFRDRATTLAAGIRRDLPALTVHDITHLDGLWEIASTIVGDDFLLTPTEGFVLGGAILLHDLAMSVAAREGGFETIQKDPRWADIITSQYRTKHSRNPTPEELRSPESSILTQSLFEILRQIHAEDAEKLSFISFSSGDGSPIFLIEDAEVRYTFGQIIGLIAHSHWWNINKVEEQFSRVIGPPAWCPRTWVVDPLKLACILRTADAAHLDARRAPMFLRALTQVPLDSEAHWRFQEKLAKPYLRQDSLVFTSTQPFRLTDAISWWLCLETLRTVDRELRNTDSLFADKGYPRFAARHVAGVDHPERLSSYVRTDGWLPINATIHVTDLPHVIKNLGGDALYGRNPQVAIRELIQNACDAVRARRLYEDRNTEFGSVKIAIKETDGVWCLEVTDNGIGMSKLVLTDFLLDFGRSFWGSPQMQEELPGLLTTSFRPTGKYGVGFFSVFMVANHVQVITRRSDAAAAETLVLEFSSGLQGRPLLRKAERGERLLDGGSMVRLKLKTNPRDRDGILYSYDYVYSLKQLTVELAPSVDVDVFVQEDGLCEKVVASNDWETIAGPELLSRVSPISHDDDIDQNELSELRMRAGQNLRILKGATGEVYGRACISKGFGGVSSGYRLDVGGTVSIGGLRACGLIGIVGILRGEPSRASRDGALPSVPIDVLTRWAEDQADLVPSLWTAPETQADCAQFIRLCGGATRNLPIAQKMGRWVTFAEIVEMSSLLESAVMLDAFTLAYELRHLESLRLDENVFVTSCSGVPGMLQSSDHHIMWPSGFNTSSVFSGGYTMATLGGAVIEALAQSWGLAVTEVVSEEELKREREVRVGMDGDREIKVAAYNIKRQRKANV